MARQVEVKWSSSYDIRNLPLAACKYSKGKQGIYMLLEDPTYSKLWGLLPLFHESAHQLDAMKCYTPALLQGQVADLLVWFRHWRDELALSPSERQ
jgi:hypothetical protein